MDQRFLVFALVVVPVLCVCLGATVHLVVRPMVQTLVDAISDLNRIMARPEAASETIELRAEVERLRSDVARLQAGRDFDRELLGTFDSPSDA